MSNSKLLKEAIADAKAVRETAIANAKIALEEAFTPRLQSILSKKLQAEMEGEEEELEEEYSDGSEAPDVDASDIGDGDNKQPADDANSSSDIAQGNPDTDVESSNTGEEDENVEVVTEEEDEEIHSEGEHGDEETHEEGYGEEEIEEEDEDELDLEAIIRELEGEDDEKHHEGTYEGEGHEEELEEGPAHDAVGYEDPTNADDAEINEEEGEDEGEEEEDVIDLDEILREMGYVSEEEHDEEEVEEGEDKDEKYESLQSDLEEAYKTIKTLRGTINEVNLLNAKLLYTNKLFRGYNLTNEQKVKVVENLDRTTSVREVKLVYATLAESMKFGDTTKKVKKTVTEGFASKPAASTAPKQEVITESADVLANRFKKLAGIK